MIEIPGRIPIRIHPLFWLLISLIGWLNSQSVFGTLLWAGVIVISVLFHEFGHALSAVMFGQKAEIELVGFGGVTKRHGPPLKHWQEFIIVLNGPLAGLLLGFFALWTYGLFSPKTSHNLLVEVLRMTFYVNLFWTVVNLLPVLPLDGAQLVRIMLEALFGLRGIRLAALLSIAVGALVSLVSFLNQYFLGGAFFMLMAFESYRAWQTLSGMTDADTKAALQDLLKQGEEAFKNGRSDEALEIFLSLRQQVIQGMIFTMATQYAAHIFADQGHYQEAYDFLWPMRKELHPEYQFLLLQVTFRLGKWEEALKIGERAFKENPTAEIALINAMCYAALGRVKPTIGWLQGACQCGLKDLTATLHRKEFDPIRLTPEFQHFQLKHY